MGKKNNSPNITEIDENGKTKTKDKKSICNAFIRVLEFSTKWASTEGRLLH